MKRERSLFGSISTAGSSWNFHGARITSDDGLLAYRGLDGAPGLTDVAITQLLDGRRGKEGRHTLVGLFRQSVFGRLAGYEDVNDAERPAHDPAMRAIVGREGLERFAASSSQMGRFGTEWLASDTTSAPMRRSPSQRSTSCWRRRTSATRFGSRPTRCCSGESATC